MKRTIVTLLIALLPGAATKAQTYIPYQWEESRTLTPLSEEARSYPLYNLLQLEQRQYVYELSGDLVCYITEHEIIHVGNDEALSQSNRIYVPMYNTLELVAVKARAIAPDGKVTYFDERNIKELKEEESGYKIFAIEGAQEGGEIEYFYTRKTRNMNFFSRHFQEDHPIRLFRYQIISPENLEYDFKVYNHSGKVTQQDTSSEFNAYVFVAENIPALHDEDYSATDNEKARIEGKLAYNSVSGKSRLLTWGDAGVRLYDDLTLEKEEMKAFQKYVKKMHLSADKPLESLRKAEHEIKTTIFMQEQAGGDADLLQNVIKNRYASSKGLTKLFAAIMDHLHIPYELVLVSDRFEKAFDGTFDSWSYLDEYLLYLSEQKQFLSPKDAVFRLGTIPSEYIGSDALFIGLEPIQDFKYPVAHIDHIPAPPYQENMDNLNLEVSFNSDLSANEVKVTRTYTGYSAQYYKMGLQFLDEDRKKEMLDQIVKYLALDAQIASLEITQANTSWDTWNDPFEVTARFSSESYLETAGETILFQVGQLIGPQAEMYQESKRMTKVTNEYNHGYLRKIHIRLPEGYQVQNPEDLILNESAYDQERLVFTFESDYHLEDQELSIEIREYYDELYYPAAKFEEFRKVVNAAADWNKLVIVLKPGT